MLHSAKRARKEAPRTALWCGCVLGVFFGCVAGVYLLSEWCFCNSSTTGSCVEANGAVSMREQEGFERKECPTKEFVTTPHPRTHAHLHKKTLLSFKKSPPRSHRPTSSQKKKTIRFTDCSPKFSKCEHISLCKPSHYWHLSLRALRVIPLSNPGARPRFN